jgi:hypothetical protein
MVAHQPQSMELTFSPSHEPRAYHIRRRKRQSLGRSLSSKIRTRFRTGRRNRSIHKLARTKSHQSHASRLPISSRHQRAQTDGQHDRQSLHQSTRQDPLTLTESISFNHMEQLPPAESPHPSPAYSGDRQHTSRPCISSVLPEESLEVEAANIRASPATVGSTRRGCICGSHVPSPTSIRELEIGSTRTSDRCSYNSMGSIQESIYESAVESNHANSAEDQRATSESGDTSGSSLALGHLVPPS